MENTFNPQSTVNIVDDFSDVIKRCVDNPQRAVYTVDVGTMTPAEAEYYVGRLIDEYWSKCGKTKQTYIPDYCI